MKQENENIVFTKQLKYKVPQYLITKKIAYDSGININQDLFSYHNYPFFINLETGEEYNLESNLKQLENKKIFKESDFYLIDALSNSGIIEIVYHYKSQVNLVYYDIMLDKIILTKKIPSKNIKLSSYRILSPNKINALSKKNELISF